MHLGEGKARKALLADLPPEGGIPILLRLEVADAIEGSACLEKLAHALLE